MCLLINDGGSLSETISLGLTARLGARKWQNIFGIVNQGAQRAHLRIRPGVIVMVSYRQLEGVVGRLVTCVKRLTGGDVSKPRMCVYV